MAEAAKKYQDMLPELKKKVEQWQDYFCSNNRRFNEFREFVCASSLTAADISVLEDTQKPTLEFNILESYVSRQRGEFAKQQPSIKVRAEDGVPTSLLTQEFIDTIKVIEAHLRAIFFDSSSNSMQYELFSDAVMGGYSVARIYTDYINEMSMEQNIYVEKVSDPTMCGFDPLAKMSHKGDGEYCFQLFPVTKEYFKEHYGSQLIEKMKFSKSINGFGWSYKNEKEDIVLLCEFYLKVKRKIKIVKLTNGHTVTETEYKEIIENWDETGSISEQAPQIIGNPRTTFLTTIERFLFCENCVIEHAFTNYKHLPYVFFDGNSVMLKRGEVSEQMTRPLVYHAKGIQKLKNFAGQSLANELENTIQHKFVAAIESIPEDYLDAYQNVQKADTLLYHHFLDSNVPEVILPPPTEIARTPIPPQISETFRMSDEMTQTILGTYDPTMGINRAELSGVAIARSAIQSNTATMPYVVGYITGLNQVAQMIVDLIPKFYRTPRSLPVLQPNGSREYVVINKSSSLYMNYDPNNLHVEVDVGVNFAMQKELAMQTIVALMQGVPSFADFVNSKCLGIIVDNLDIRGAEEMKLKAQEYEKELAQKQNQEMQAQQMQTMQAQRRQQLEDQLIQRQMQSPTDAEAELVKTEEKAKTDAANIAIKEQEAETKFLETLSKIRANETEMEIEQARSAAENARTAVEVLTDMTQVITDESRLE